MRRHTGQKAVSLTSGLGTGKCLAIDGVRCGLVLAVAAQALYGLGQFGGRGLHSFYEDWLYNGTELAAAALVFARAVLVPRERIAWLLLAIGMAGYAGGDLYYTVAIEGTSNPPFPSPGDAGYLLLYPCAYAMIARLVRDHVRHLHTSVWLDGAIGGLTVAAVGAALLLDPVIHSTHGSFAAVATNLAYPLGDVVLVMLVIGVVALTDWRPGRTWLLIALGFSLLAVADSIYLFRVAERTYVAGTVLDAMWPAGMTILSWAAWAQPRAVSVTRRAGRFTVMALPCLFAGVALFLLIRADFVRLGVLPETLAAAAVLAAGWRFALTFDDVLRISELRERQARTDDLTGLANRRQFYTRLSEAVEACQVRGASFALLMIDLDRFKELNDTLGHHAGDTLLAQIGPRLERVVRGEAVARLGGDEFALVVRDATAAATVAERIHDALRQPFELDEITVSVHASVGIAIYPDDAEDASMLMRRADAAMYHAKHARARHAFYAGETDRGSRDQYGLAAELKDALAHGGLVVHYQPQMRLDSGAVSGIEALARWQHPRRGLIEAEDFLYVVERAGAMRELTQLVLDQSLSQQRAWRARGHDVVLAVNIAASSLLDPTFPGDLRERLRRWQTQPGRLRLELTEGVLIEESTWMSAAIEALRELGVGLSLDDFGTGYSPISYLTEMPVSELKIDGTFIAGMMRHRPTAIVVEGTVALARRLEIPLVAEGVETAAQLEHLRSIGCPHAQGYFLSRPMSAQELDRWLEAGSFRGAGNVCAPADRQPSQTVGGASPRTGAGTRAPSAAGRRLRRPALGGANGRG